MKGKQGFQKGNKDAVKLKDVEIMKQAYASYCEHIAKGWSKRGWHFDHPTHSCVSKTMDKYIAENPDVFPAIHREVAEAKGYQHWEELGKTTLVGKVKGAQPAIYQMFMRNKFGWDKESTITHSFEPEVRKILAKWESEC